MDPVVMDVARILAALEETRGPLLTELASYREKMQLPLHLTGEQLTIPQELGAIQELFRRLLEHRERLATVTPLYTCNDCGHFEGERHASDCKKHALGVIARPPLWMPTVPVQIIEFTPQPCPVEGCIYMQLPGTGFCAQHQLLS